MAVMIGGFRDFDHEPTEAEVSRALQEMAAELAGKILNDAVVIRKGPEDHPSRRWTVAFKTELRNRLSPPGHTSGTGRREDVPR